MGDIVQYQPQSGSLDLTLSRAPAEVLKEATNAANALKEVILKTDAVVQIGPSKHLKCEAWQTLGHFYGLTARIRETRFVQYGNVVGFEAFADLVHVQSGRVISSAEAMCLNDEERWSSRPEYAYQDTESGRQKVKVGDVAVPLQQIRSMAQTRALSKVHRNALAWVVVLAGFNPTPAEEMEGNEHQRGRQAPSMPQRTTQSAPSGSVISEPQRKRLWALAHGGKRTNDEVKAILQAYGFERSEDVTKDKYEAICADLMKVDGPGAA